MALLTAVSFSSVPVSAMSVTNRGCPPLKYNRLSCNIPIKASLSPSSSSPRESRSTESTVNSSSASSSSSRPQTDASFDYAFANSAAAAGGNPVFRFVRSTESSIERIIFDFRFLALLAIGGSLAGSLLCFLNGCIYIIDAYKVYWSSCVKGIHTGNMVLRLVEAIDVYLAGTVMLIFGMGLYGLFISNVPPDAHPSVDRALKGSSLYGMFALKERPKWMKISSLDELKTKVGHVIVMILLVKMFERSKMLLGWIFSVILYVYSCHLLLCTFFIIFTSQTQNLTRKFQYMAK